MRWYADNSELNGIRGAAIPDILLFGGVAIAPESEAELRKRIEAVKAKFGNPRAPIKWNFKDLKALYQKQDKGALYQKMLESSKDWRLELAHAVADIDFTIILACIESHSVDKCVIKNVKDDLTRFVFSNGLMRVALHAKEAKPDRTQVVLDWPDRGDSKPFDSEYASAYNAGRTKGGNVPYHSGPLSVLGFMDSPGLHEYASFHPPAVCRHCSWCDARTNRVCNGEERNWFWCRFCQTCRGQISRSP